MRKDIGLNFEWFFKPEFSDEMIKNDNVKAKMVEMKRKGSTADQVRAWLINAAICTLIGL